ncbi:gamma-glutamyl-gamma-aminobutyrate hydrolase family protein [Paenibacillus koleovorans]|uniref:gamma-glutamyl-gamma-aminobutyrate hydrolase family protein n=1 Tax=Paenibacillus koleovorans TaxID=121608 RepID=UPI000FD96CF5|nr:gamma-glutamyl-gamma-aminobutyrate hydrolase family protein [Paenibacillus koleovorans]
MTNKKPLIAVTTTNDKGHTFLHRDYSDAILLAGGIPFVIPSMGDADIEDELVEAADGLLLTGGEDIDPNLYGEEPAPGLGTLTPERDATEKRLLVKFMAADKPVFAICRGLQLLNAVAGGTLIQDIERALPNALQHRQLAPRDHLSHQVEVEEGTLLMSIVRASRVRVNTFHHQAVKQLAPGFRINATAVDGIVEGIESLSQRFVLGVQWHPENLARTDAAAIRLFEAFVQACRFKESIGAGGHSR